MRKLKHFFFTLTVLAASLGLNAQINFINENFSGGSGNTPPTGWVSNRIQGSASYDYWRFVPGSYVAVYNDYPRSAASPVSGNFALFDADYYSSGGGYEEVALESPSVSTLGQSVVRLKWDQRLGGNYGGFVAVDVFDGTLWHEVYYKDDQVGAASTSHDIDVSAYVANKANVKVRFYFFDDWGYWWIVDNVRLFAPATPVPNFTINTTPQCLTSNSFTYTNTSTIGEGTMTYSWTFGDVTGSTSTSPTKTYGSANTYNVQLTATSNYGIIASTTKQVVVNAMTATSVTAGATPAGAICAGTPVSFTATPIGGGASPTYQWKKNGVNVGTNSATYNAGTGLVNGDAITVAMTSNATCPAPATATSTAVNMTVNPLLTPSVTISANPGNSFCPGTPVTFTPAPVNGGAAPTYQWKVNGGNVATGSTYTTSLLSHNDVVSCVMTSNATCPSPTTATSNNITINTQFNTAVSIVANPAGPVCPGANIIFTATPTNSGATPTYVWKRNGVPVGANSPTFSTSAHADGDVYTVEMTSSIACANPLTTGSNPINISHATPLVPSVAIGFISGGSNICAGVAVSLQATPTNGGATPSYQWKVNGSNVGTNSPYYFNPGTLNNGDAITVVMTPNPGCFTTATTTSNTINMTVNPVLVPSVTVSPNPGSTICAGTSVMFTALPTNGGSPSYQWKRNGTNVGTNSQTYTNASLANNDVITVVMTGNATCATMGGAATSTPITMTVNPNVTPSVSISSSAGSSTCAGNEVTFTATPTNGGPSPSYQWRVNGSNVTGAGNKYTTTSLTNGNVVSCVMTSSAPCPTQPTATSGNITMTVNPVLVPSVTITPNPGFSICSGTGVTFTATPTNGGGSPAYQWRKNGAIVGSNSPTYNGGTGLANNDIITCRLTSNATCAIPNTDFDTVQMSVTTTITPAVSLTSVPGNNVCAGSAVSFIANTTTGGSAPGYQWKINGSNVGTNTPSYTALTLSNGDIVTVQMTSNAPCKTTTTATNSTTMTVNPLVTPTISIAAGTGNDICTGTPVTFTATISNGGSSPVYQWKKNGVNVGTNSASYAAGTGLVNGDVITCSLTSNAPCKSPAVASSNAIMMNVGVIPAVSITTTHPQVICAGDLVTFTAIPVSGGINPGYVWKVNGVDMGINSNVFLSDTLLDGDVVTATMATSLNCPSMVNTTSNSLTATVVQPVTPSISVTASPDASVCAGTTVNFTAQYTNAGLTPVYQWTKNGQNISGATAASYISSTVATNDVYACHMQSSLTCALPVSSNDLVMTVNPLMPTSAVIIGIPTEEPNTILFHSNVTNGGPAAVYQWKKNNNIIQGANQPTYLAQNLKDNDVISLQVESNEVCASPATFSSNQLAVSKVVSVSSVVGTMEELTLFPNPNEGTFTVKGKLSQAASNNAATIEVLNALGQVVYKTEATLKGSELETRISLNNAAGMYMLNVNIDGHKQTIRFMVK